MIFLFVIWACVVIFNGYIQVISLLDVKTKKDVHNILKSIFLWGPVWFIVYPIKFIKKAHVWYKFLPANEKELKENNKKIEYIGGPC